MGVRKGRYGITTNGTRRNAKTTANFRIGRSFWRFT